MSSPKLTNRREFLRLSTLTTVGAALVAACAPAVPPTPTPVPATATSATKPDAAATTAPAPTTQPAPKPTEAPKPAAATAAPQAGAKGKVIWDTFRGVGTTWPEDRIRAFEKANEGWTVEFRPIPIPGGQGDAYPKMYAMFAAGTLGDVFAFDQAHLEFYRAVPRGLIRALDDYVAADRFDLGQFYPPFVEAQRLDGKLWGLPSWGWSGGDGIIYNQVLFQQNGIKEPDAANPELSLDSVREIARKLTKMGSGGSYERYGINLILDTAGATIFARAAGAPDYFDPKRSLLDNPDVLKGLRWVNDLCVADKSVALPGTFSGTPENLFAAGKLAIIHGGTWHILNAHMAIKDEKAAVVRTALFPKRKDGIRPSQSRVGTWNVGAKSKSPEAAWKFVQTLTSREGVLNFTMFGQGIALVRPDIMNHPYFSHPGFRVYLENLLTAMPSTVPANGRGTELTQTFNQRWAEVYLAKTPFEQGMKALHESIQRVLDKPAD